jgi:hypothetical protein
MRATRDAIQSFRFRAFPALFLAVAFAAGGRTPWAAADTFDVGCDVFTLAGVVNTANRNGEEDLIWLSPPCRYETLDTVVVQADGGNPVRIQGRGATISGQGLHTVLAVEAGAVVELTGVTLTEGAVTGNGGVVRNAGTLSLAASTVSHGTASGYGGGIYNTGTLRLVRSTVADNTANVEGGGIDNAGQGRLTLVDSTVRGNTGLYGGGIRNGARAALYNSSLFGNGGFIGGGLLNEGAGNAHLGNVTISGNAVSGSDGGGGVRNEATLAIDNSIVANTAFGLADCSNSGTLQATGGNLIEDGSCAVVGALAGDPMLVGPGGVLAFLPLAPGSPAIDAGSNASCPGFGQDGSRRPRDGFADGTSVCDLGSYESACGLLGAELFLVLPFARWLRRARSRRG